MQQNITRTMETVIFHDQKRAGASEQSSSDGRRETEYILYAVSAPQNH